jgi:protein SCO1/2
MPTLRAIVAIWLAASLAPMSTAADTPNGRLDPQRAIERSESAIGRTLGAYSLKAINGEIVSLASLRDKPLVVSLVYSACSSVCPVTTQTLIDAVEQANRLFGPDRFNVLTIGFDARNDTPARMAHFAATQGILAPNWQVASADSGTISAVLNDLGFSYASVAGGFDHITQTTILEPGGKVYRHVYGDDFPLRMFMEPLRDVVQGRSAMTTVSGLVDRIKYICTTYDPGAGRYKTNYGVVFGSGAGAAALLLFAFLILREWRKTGRQA